MVIVVRLLRPAAGRFARRFCSASGTASSSGSTVFCRLSSFSKMSCAEDARMFLARNGVAPIQLRSGYKLVGVFAPLAEERDIPKQVSGMARVATAWRPKKRIIDGKVTVLKTKVTVPVADSFWYAELESTAQLEAALELDRETVGLSTVRVAPCTRGDMERGTDTAPFVGIDSQAVLLSNLPPRVQPEMLEGLLRGYSWAETGPVVQMCTGGGTARVPAQAIVRLSSEAEARRAARNFNMSPFPFHQFNPQLHHFDTTRHANMRPFMEPVHLLSRSQDQDGKVQSTQCTESTVYVSGLPFDVDEGFVAALFADCGKVCSVRVARRRTGEMADTCGAPDMAIGGGEAGDSKKGGKGFAFVELESPLAAREATRKSGTYIGWPPLFRLDVQPFQQGQGRPPSLVNAMQPVLNYMRATVFC